MKLRNKYSIQFKFKCLELTNILGYYRTSIIIRIKKICIKDWYLNWEKLQNIIKKNCTYRIPGRGCKVKRLKKEEEVLYFIIKCKEIGIILTPNLVFEEYCRNILKWKNIQNHL
jgi:hypothetical protein